MTRSRLLNHVLAFALIGVLLLGRLEASPLSVFPVSTLTPTAALMLTLTPIEDANPAPVVVPTEKSTLASTWTPMPTHTPSPTPDEPAIRACPGLPAPQLIIGAYGRVRPTGQGNRLRTQPSTSGEQIGTIPLGRLFFVLEGPECADGVTWWRVRFNELEGWTAESVSSAYYAEPVSGGRMELDLSGLDIDSNDTNDTHYGAYQPFQRGHMFWLEPIDDMWVLYTTGRGRGTWEVYRDLFYEGDTETDPSLRPPTGLQQPRRGFGRIWRDNDPVRGGLGWATQSEQGFTIRYQYDPTSRTHTIYSPSGTRFNLSDDGTWSS